MSPQGSILSAFQSFESLIMATALLMARGLTIFSVLPFFVEQAVPLTVRMSFVLALSLCMLPLVSPQLPLLQSDWIIVFPYFLKEIGLGLVLGLMSSIMFWALFAAGTIIEYQAGMTMGTIIDPLSGQEDSLVGALFMQLFSIVFIVGGGLLGIIGLLFDSYKVWPIDKMAPLLGNNKLVTVFLGGMVQLVETVLKIAAPFVILMLVAELALGLLSRFAPQLNVFFLSLSAKIIILMVLLLVYCALLSETTQLLPDFNSMLNTFREVLR